MARLKSVPLAWMLHGANDWPHTISDQPSPQTMYQSHHHLEYGCYLGQSCYKIASLGLLATLLGIALKCVFNRLAFTVSRPQTPGQTYTFPFKDGM